MTEQINELAAYHKQINLALFNDIVAFIMKTTTEDSAPLTRKLNAHHLWYSFSGSENVQESYGFHYFGELLERHEERLQNRVEDLRAIALAMACAKELLTENMFVGRQKINFMQKIRRLSKDDVYLKGALYLLAEGESSAESVYEELIQTRYTQTEELIFVLSLFGEFERIFGILKPQLIELLGRNRSIPVIGNTKLFCWLVKKMEPVIKKSRTKDTSLLRALVSFPTSYVKPDSRNHSILLENGYTKEEIVYANIMLIQFRPLYGTLAGNSIVTEKVVVDLFKTFLNCENAHDQAAYTELIWLYERYRNFEIKCYGAKTLLDAIRDGIQLKNPQTFLWWLDRVWDCSNREFFYFDIMDGKWDVLAAGVEKERYRELFELQLEKYEDMATEEIAERIKKYDQLTGASYLESFDQEHAYRREASFSLLVSKGLIDLAPVFAAAIDEDNHHLKPGLLTYIGDYIKGIHTRQAFSFYQHFFKKYSVAELDGFFSYGYGSGFHAGLLNDSAHYFGHYERNKELTLERDFLTPEEHLQLLNWLEDYMFYCKPEDYLKYVAALLRNDFVLSIVPKQELRTLYDKARVIAEDTIKNCSEQLKQKFLTTEELQAESNAEAARRLERKRQQELEEQQEILNRFGDTFDGTIKSMVDYIDYYRYYKDRQEIAAAAIYDALGDTLSAKKYQLVKSEIVQFLFLCGKMFKTGALTLHEFQEYLKKLEEVAADEDAGNIE